MLPVSFLNRFVGIVDTSFDIQLLVSRFLLSFAEEFTVIVALVVSSLRWAEAPLENCL